MGMTKSSMGKGELGVATDNSIGTDGSKSPASTVVVVAVIAAVVVVVAGIGSAWRFSRSKTVALVPVGPPTVEGLDTELSNFEWDNDLWSSAAMPGENDVGATEV